MQFRTLDDLKKQEKTKKGNTTSYTGGENSGLAVQNPDVAKLMEKASLNSKSEEEYQEQKKKKPNGQTCKITLYQNGFRIQQEDFRPYSDQKSKAFMTQLNQGIIPKELRAKYPKGGLTISLSDHTSQVYTPPPPPPYTAFKGTSVSLGGKIQETKQEIKKPKTDNKFPVNQKKPKTLLNIRYHNGDKQTIQVNLDSKLNDIYEFVKRTSGLKKFNLLSGFPPSAVKLQQTISQQGLQDSTVIQKI